MKIVQIKFENSFTINDYFYIDLYINIIDYNIFMTNNAYPPTSSSNYNSMFALNSQLYVKPFKL
jgi:hypothetical protein